MKEDIEKDIRTMIGEARRLQAEDVTHNREPLLQKTLDDYLVEIFYPFFDVDNSVADDDEFDRV